MNIYELRRFHMTGSNGSLVNCRQTTSNVHYARLTRYCFTFNEYAPSQICDDANLTKVRNLNLYW
jgi:hypothetical protein